METIKLNARYGYKHTLNHITKNLWQLNFDPKSTGTYRLIGFDGENTIGNLVYAIDPEGGPFIAVGSEIDDKIVKSITINGIIELE